MAWLYPIPNGTNIAEWMNATTSNICQDVSNPATCGAFWFFDFMLVVAWLILFSSFRYKHSFKDSYAGASTITAFFGIILYVMPFNFIRDLELIFLLVNMFISVIALFLIKE